MVKSFASLCKLLQISTWANGFIKNCQSRRKTNWHAHIIRDNRNQSTMVKYAQYEVIDTMGVKNL